MSAKSKLGGRSRPLGRVGFTLFEQVYNGAEPVDELASKIEAALKTLYDTTRIEERSSWRQITAVKGTDTALSTYGDVTGLEISVRTDDGESITIDWHLIVMAGRDKGTGLARKTVDAVIDVCDHFSEDAEITIELEDWSEGFWEHIAEDYDWVSWDIRPEN